jgi:uncharacterized membrane protein YgcG
VIRVALACALLLGAAAAHAVERVLDFAADIRIEADGTLLVTERIAVQVEGREIRRGILRDFPTDYRDRAGSHVRVPFEVLRVMRDDVPEPYTTTRVANGVQIRIGNPDVMLSHGKHEYVIAYRTGRQLGFFTRHDELYWNVNGNGWTFAMDRVAADVKLPVAIKPEQLRVEAYTGFQGARGRSYETETREGGATFRTTRALAPHEGLTIVFAFPKGIVTPPGVMRRAQWWLGDNRGALVGVGAIVALVAFLWWRWSRVGRDPRAGPRFPRYEAPPGLGPAGVRFVNRMGYDDHCFAVALLGLGARGHLKIKQQGDRYAIEPTGGAVEWLPGEQSLSDNLLKKREAFTFGREHDPEVTKVRDRFRAALERHFGTRLFSRNRGSVAVGFLIAAFSLPYMVLLETPVLFVIGTVVTMILVLVAFARWLPAYSIEGRKLQDAIEGLRQYLGVAEANDLARMKAPPQTPQEFAKFLPYAVALDVEKTWADRFVATLGAAAVAAAVADYYHSDSSSGGFDRDGIGDFTDSLSSMGSTISAAATPPGSESGSSDSGGGGGGSSGGGGGGGGGSGW